MPMNRIQFQQGMSLPEFLRSFGTEEQCAAAVAAARWPGGYACPRCAASSYWTVKHQGRELFQCGSCRHQTSLIAGTMFASTKLPLTTWFLAIYLLSQAKTGLSALALKRQLGVSYPTAWLMHHKILHAMAEREQAHRLDGMVQIDDAYLGGERSDGSTGRGTTGKTPFVAAVSLNDAGHPLYVKLSTVPAFASEAIGLWACRNLHPGALVISDGLACFAGVASAQCLHAPTVVGRIKPKDLPEFQWVNTVLGNLKRTIAGAHHSFKFAKYADAYLAGFAYRFNRRFDLRALVARLIVDVTRTKPRPVHVVRQAEEHC